MKFNKANLFLVGAMKAGTTSLADALSHHPQVHLSPIKEPHFFLEKLPPIFYRPSKFYSEEEYFNTYFLSPMHIAHVTKLENYHRLFDENGNAKHFMDASTMYLHAPGAAKKIHDYNPQAKIIIITRDPLQRSFSHYRMLQGLSREIRSFEKVILEDIGNYRNGELAWYSCLGMSFYKSSIQEYQKLFKDVLLIDFASFTTSKEVELKRICTFLEISFLEPSSDSKMEKVNKSRTLKFKRLFFFLNQLGLKDYFSRMFSSTIKRKLYNLFSSSRLVEPELSESTLNELKRIFEIESL